MEMHLYKVGELYHPGRTTWDERSDYNYRSGGHELRIFYNRPKSAEIKAIGRGPSRFALYVEGSVILLCHAFPPHIPWGDSPFSIHLVQKVFPEEAGLPEMPEPFAERALVTILLIDATTGIIRAMRVVSFSPSFTAELHSAIRAQAAMPWNEAEFARTQAAIYRRFSTTDHLVKSAVVTCEGGKEDG